MSKKRKITKEEINDIFTCKDISKMTNAIISEDIDISLLEDKPKTDILLEVMIRKNKTLFNAILNKGFPSKDNKFFCYTHKAVATDDLYFVEKIFEHYEKNNIDIFEFDKHKNNALHIAFGMTVKNQKIIDYLTKKGISLTDKNKEGCTPKDLI